MELNKGNASKIKICSSSLACSPSACKQDTLCNLRLLLCFRRRNRRQTHRISRTEDFSYDSFLQCQQLIVPRGSDVSLRIIHLTLSTIFAAAIFIDIFRLTGMSHVLLSTPRSVLASACVSSVQACVQVLPCMEKGRGSQRLRINSEGSHSGPIRELRSVCDASDREGSLEMHDA